MSKEVLTKGARPLVSPGKHGHADCAEPPDLRSRKSTILVVDDHPILREGIVALVNRESDLDAYRTG